MKTKSMCLYALCAFGVIVVRGQASEPREGIKAPNALSSLSIETSTIPSVESVSESTSAPNVATSSIPEVESVSEPSSNFAIVSGASTDSDSGSGSTSRLVETSDIPIETDQLSTDTHSSEVITSNSSIATQITPSSVPTTKLSSMLLVGNNSTRSIPSSFGNGSAETSALGDPGNRDSPLVPGGRPLALPSLPPLPTPSLPPQRPYPPPWGPGYNSTRPRLNATAAMTSFSNGSLSSTPETSSMETTGFDSAAFYNTQTVIFILPSSISQSIPSEQ